MSRQSISCNVESILGINESDLVQLTTNERASLFDNDEKVFIHQQTGKRTPFGQFDVVRVSELRDRVGQLAGDTTPRTLPAPKLTMASGIDIGALQGTLKTNDKAMVQVASNFNCLENGNARMAADSGRLVDKACRDCTQGPAAAFGALSAYTYRAHFCHQGGGQTADKAINLLRHVSSHFGSPVNGKLILRGNESSIGTSDAEMDDVVQDICIGLHQACPILFGRDGRGYLYEMEDGKEQPLVDQIFTASINLHNFGKLSEEYVSQFDGDGNGRESSETKALHHMARVLLRAAYEATYLSAILQQRKTLLLTLVGGGSFGNPMSVIIEELERAHARWAGHPASKLEKCQLCLFSERDEREAKKYLNSR